MYVTCPRDKKIISVLSRPNLVTRHSGKWTYANQLFCFTEHLHYKAIHARYFQGRQFLASIREEHLCLVL